MWAGGYIARTNPVSLFFYGDVSNNHLFQLRNVCRILKFMSKSVSV